MKKISREFDKILDPIFKTKGNILYQLTKCWPQIIGEDLAFHVYPTKVTFNKDYKTLYIACSSPGVAAELFYHENIILEKIHCFSGIAKINKIKFHVGYPTSTITNSVNNLKNRYTMPLAVIDEIIQIKDELLLQSLQNFAKIFTPGENL